MQTCVSVISSFAIGNAFTCSKLYTICKSPWSKKNQTVVRGEAVEGCGAEGGGSGSLRRHHRGKSESVGTRSPTLNCKWCG